MPTFYTGEGDASPIARYIIEIQDESWLIENFIGALDLLGVVENWEQDGVITPEIAAERSNDALVTFRRYETLIGSIQLYATEIAPSDTLPCDGASYLRVNYPVLYAVLADFYKTDADNFVVPDLYQGDDLKYCIMAV